MALVREQLSGKGILIEAAHALNFVRMQKKAELRTSALPKTIDVGGKYTAMVAMSPKGRFICGFIPFTGSEECTLEELIVRKDDFCLTEEAIRGYIDAKGFSWNAGTFVAVGPIYIPTKKGGQKVLNIDDNLMQDALATQSAPDQQQSLATLLSSFPLKPSKVSKRQAATEKRMKNDKNLPVVSTSLQSKKTIVKDDGAAEDEIATEPNNKRVQKDDDAVASPDIEQEATEKGDGAADCKAVVRAPRKEKVTDKGDADSVPAPKRAKKVIKTGDDVSAPDPKANEVPEKGKIAAVAPKMAKKVTGTVEEAVVTASKKAKDIMETSKRAKISQDKGSKAGSAQEDGYKGVELAPTQTTEA
jgi:hypothetical protein